MQLDGLLGERSSRSGHSENPGQPLSGMIGGGVETLLVHHELCHLDLFWRSFDHLKKYDRDPLWHRVGVGEPVMVVQDHDCANHAARHLH